MSTTGTSFQLSMVGHLKETVADTWDRQERAKQDPSSFSKEDKGDLLNHGTWYPEDYYAALQHFGAKKRIKEFVGEDTFYRLPIMDKHFQCVTSQSKANAIGVHRATCIIDKDTTPSEALRIHKTALGFLDCGATCLVAANRALQERLGEEKFDHLFAKDSPSPFCLSWEHSPSIAKLFTSQDIAKEEDIQVGDICHFSNINRYIVKHHAGSSRGYNVVCCSTEPRRYIGLGLSPEGVSGQEIEQTLWNNYNLPPDEAGMWSNSIWTFVYQHAIYGDEERSVLAVDAFRNNTVTWDEFNKTPCMAELKGEKTIGKLYGSVHRPNIELVEQLAEADIKDVRALFNPGSSSSGKQVAS